MHSRLVNCETVTDAEGKFSFGPHAFFHGVPIFTGTEENLLIVYRPGYGFIETSSDQGVIEITRVPFNCYARSAEANKAQSSYATDFHETKLLKAAVEQEKSLLKELPELTKGVLYKMQLLNDVAIDSRGNLYLANNRDIVKLPRKGDGYDTVNVGETTIQNSSGRIDLEIDHDKLYALQEKRFLRINVSASAEEDSPLATKEYIPGKGLVKYRTITGISAAVSPGSSKPPQIISTQVTEPEILAESNQNNFFPYHEYRFSIGSDGMIHLGDSLFQTNGSLIGKLPLDTSSMKRQTPPKIVDTITDDEGNTLVAFYFPSESGPYRSGVAIYDRNNRFVGVKPLSLKFDVAGIAAANGRYYACDRESFYLLDKEFAIVSRQTLALELFGEYTLNRIKVDPAGEHLFLVDGRYDRLLWYDLKTDSWR